MKELVNYKDVSKNQREVWGSSRLTTKLNLVLKILLIRPTKDPADPLVCRCGCAFTSVFLYHKT